MEFIFSSDNIITETNKTEPDGFRQKVRTIMKWIELKNGITVNLENVYYIALDGKEVNFHFADNEYACEEFDTEKDAEARLKELKKKLL